MEWKAGPQMKFSIDTVDDTLTFEDGKKVSIPLMWSFLNLPRGTVVESMGPDEVTGHPRFRTLQFPDLKEIE